MQNMLLVLHLIICVVLVGAVLMQRSEGGALGMGGGGGGLISGRGAADMMVNITSWVGGAFFVTSIFLTVLAGGRPADRSVITDGQERPGFQLNIPFLNKQDAAPKVTAPDLSQPSAPVAAPAPTTLPVDGAVAPTPTEAATRAGPLEQSAAPAPVGAVKAAAPTTTPATAGPLVAAPVGAAKTTTSGPVGAAPKTTTARPPVTTQKTTPAPMIPLSPQALPGPAESPQPADPAPSRDRNGPDE